MNAVGVFAASMVWIFMICSFPYIADGLCGGRVACAASLPPLMVGASNIAAFVGRIMGNFAVGDCPLWAMLLESAAFTAFGLSAILFSEGFSVSHPTAFAILGSVFLVLWSNMILVRLFAEAQRQTDHVRDICVAKTLSHCAIKSQLSWVALQVGCLAGTGLSFLVQH